MDKQILLVDDEEQWIAFDRQQLSGIQARVTSATTLQDAIRNIETDCPDVIVLDMALLDEEEGQSRPVPDKGLEVLDFVKQQKLPCRVIVLTASADYALHERCREAGAYHVIRKIETILLNELRREVEDALFRE